MDLFIRTTVGLTGIWLISIVLMMETKNFISFAILKLVPFFLGLACLFSSAKLFGWI